MSEPTYRALCYSDAGCLKHCWNLPARHCVTGLQAVIALSEPTYHALCCRGAGCFSNGRTYLPGSVLQWCRLFNGVGTYLPGTVLQWGRLFKRCRNLPAVHCVTVVKAVLAMSESTCQALCYSGKGCFRSVRTYLPGTCVAGVQTVSAMSEPTCGALCCMGADCLSSVRTYLPELCYSGAGWLSSVGTFLPGYVLQWCRLFKQCQNLPAGHCVTVVQTF